MGETPARADHIGSLLRPKRLTAGYRALRAGELEPAAYAVLLDECVAEAVARQREVGLTVVTDGEFRRASYWSHFVDAVDGLEVRSAAYRFHDAAGEEHEFLAPYCRARLRRTRSIGVGELEAVQRCAEGSELTPKVTLPSPSTLHFWGGTRAIEPGVYPDADAYLDDLCGIYRAELAALGAAGARYVQLDEVPIAMLCDPAVRARVRDDGEDPDRRVRRYVQCLNAAMAGRPPGMRIGVHLCRGNHQGRWLSEGGYEAVARELFEGCEADVFLLEFDTARAGGFEPLAHVPAGKQVVLGLLSSKLDALEARGPLVERIEAAARYLPLEQLGLSPQCGFSSTVLGNPLDEAAQWAKLARVVEVAREVWGSP